MSVTWLTFHPVSFASSFQCLCISKALLINLKITNIIVSLLLDLHAPKFKLAFAVVAELSPPSSIDLDAFNMTTLDDIDLLSLRAFLITTRCNYTLIQSLEADYLLSPRPSSLLFASNPTHILNFLTRSELWNLPASNILEYAKLHSREVNNIIRHFEDVISKIQEINMPGMFPLHSDVLYFWFILVIQLILPLHQFLNW